MADGEPGGLRILPAGDSALLAVLDGAVGPATSERVHALAAAVTLLAVRLPGVGAPVPGHASVLVPFEPLRVGEEAVTALIREASGVRGAPAAAEEPPPLEVPVRYGGEDGPDLAAVAAATGLASDAVIALHAGTIYTVLIVGFTPGFAYLGNLPPALELPRRATPRTAVPAGSVAIAARQTAVYPAATPGGWHLIGRTPLVAWDPAATPPTPFRPGRRVRFFPA